MPRKTLSFAGKFWLGYLALLVAAGLCVMVH